MVRENDLGRRGFRAWAFLPGMLFNSAVKWWGGGGRRALSHEGIDLCLFEDRLGRLFSVGQGTRVTAMYGGRVVAVIDDFLGKSVLIEHRRPRAAPGLFLTVYGHTSVREGLRPGSAVTEGEIIGRVAGPGKSKARAYPHLHVSLARPLAEAAYETVTWRDLNNPQLFTMIDPLEVLDGPCVCLSGTVKAPV
jgi:murein DD-endopeptidase MepM/ murein hydrolase activator NlpD